MGEWFREQALGGAMPVALVVATLAGMASFLSPCVLPLVPGYLAYMTGLTGAELENRRRRSHVLAGTLLFLSGLTFVLMTQVVTFGAVGSWLFERQTLTVQVFGLVVIIFGIAFMGLIPILQRHMRLPGRPDVGLGAAPVLGVLMGIGWTPCIGPTLGTVIGLASATGTASRGVALGIAYAMGLGVPFLITGLMYSRSLGAIKFVRRHQVWVTRIGGLLLVSIGLLFLTGYWELFVQYVQVRLLDTPLGDVGSDL